jgi:ABC-type bacteriocin/lantibiotic exporter with double-glycine peptidase domain
MELIANMKKDKFTAALLYIGIFAGIPLAIIVALFFLPVLNSVDPTAVLILIIFTVILVALWISVPYEKTVQPQRRSAKQRKAAVRRAVPVPSEASE